jgi:hypothetical protein
LNAIRLSLACLQDSAVTVFLNRFDAQAPLHALNGTWLRERYGIAILTEIDELLESVCQGM